MSAANILWCVLQVTLVGLLTAGLYLGVRRMSPRSAAAVLLAGLTLPLALTAGVYSPWPCWMKETAPPAPIVVAAEPRTEFVAAPHPMAPMPDIEYSSMPADDFETIEDVAIVPATPATPVEITHEPSVTVAQPDWRRLGFALIAAMLLAGVVRLIAGWLAIRRLLAGSRPVEPFEALQLLAELRQALAVSTTVDLRESDALTTAATVGWRQPAILLPRAWQDWTNCELRAVLAHELAHVARGHYGAWILAQLGLSLHYYHPLLHWLAARLRLEQEYEADALAAEVTGGATAYLRTLAHLALIQPETPVSWPARAFLARPGTVVRRIVRLQQSRVTRPARSLPNVAMLVLMLCGGLVAAGFRQPTRAADNPSDATTIAAGTKPDSKSAPTADKELPTLEELTQAVAARERAYLPFHIKAMQTFVMSEGLTAVERSKFPWADGRKHQKLMEYAQREPGTWFSIEAMLVDGVSDMEYEWHVSGGREVQVSHRVGETGAGDIYLPDPARSARPYVWAQPLLGVFPLIGTSEPRLLSEALKQSETETHLDADGENAKLTVVTGPKEFQSRVVVWLSRAHDWHPVRAQFFLRRKVEELLYEWEARKLEWQDGQWRVLAGTMQWFDNESQAGSLKKTYALEFEIQEPTYGDAVSAALFSYEIPAGASVRNERDPKVELAAALTRDVAVTVVDVHGSPVPGATVTSKSRGFERLARELVNFSTDESGRATVRAPDGDFGLLVHKDGSRDANWGLGADVREMKVILAPITAGMVVDEHATPLKDVWVTSDHHSMPQFRFDGVINDPRNDVGFSQRSAWSDDAGRFSLTSELTVRRTSDTVLISAMDLDQEHMASVYVPAAQLGEPLTLMLKRICEINGTCLLEGIKERIPVGLSVEDREGRPLASVATVTSVAENGLRVQFKLRLPPGEYRLQSPHSSGYSAISIPLEVPEGQRTLHLEEQNIKPSGITELIGKPAPALQGSWRSGEETTLEALRGNVVVLDFWGYWCQPCLAGMPKLMEIADEFKDQPVKWLAIHDPHELAREELDAKLAEITKTVWKGRALSFPVMIDAATGDDDRTGVTGERYDVREWPTLILIDRNGNVAGAVTYDRLRDKIQSLLPEKREDSKTGAETKRTIGAVAAVNAEKPAAAKSQNIVISGRVTEPGGKPAGGAMVVLPINQGWNGTQRDVVQGVTDGGGRFSLRVPLSSLRTKDWYIRMLWVYQRGFGVATQFVADQLSGQKPVQPVEIVLPADSEPQFRIVTEAGRPVSGAAVEIHYYDDRIGNSHYFPLELIPLLATTSNDDGVVVIPSVAEKKLWRIKVRTPQYGEQGFRVAGLGDETDLQLKNAIPLQGRLTAENPEWVRNVRLQIVTGSGDVDLPGAVCEATAITDEKGQFSVSRMTVGPVYFAAALDPALPVRLQQSNEWRVQEDAELVLRLVPATQVRGRVVRKDDHQPLAGVNVSVQHGIHRQDTSVVTNADGEYETRVLPGRVYVQLGGDFYPELLDRRRGAMTPYEVPAIETSFALPTIELSSTYTRSGRLLDAGGKPLADYQIGAKGEGDLWGSDDITNELGEFRVHFPRDCEIKEYHYQSRLGEERGTATVLSADPLVLQTEATATDKEPRAARPAAEKAESIIITGQVIDAGGTPAAGAMVVLPINSGWGGARRDVAEGATDEEGRYELRVPPEWLPAPPRHYGSTVWAYKAGFGIANASAYKQLQTAEPRQAIDLALHADSKPTFRIVDEAGAPLIKADVSIEHYRRQGAMDFVPDEILRRIAATPDANGVATLSGVEAGMLYQVRVRSDRYGIQTFQVNDLPAGSELKLRSAAPLSGRIVGGRPEWARNVNLVLLSKADRSGPQGRAEVVTDANGQFSVPMMATGDVLIFESLDESLPVRLRLPSRARVPLENPLELALIPVQRVKGRAVRKDDGTPVPGVQVYVRYDQDRQTDIVVTDANGEFEAGVIPGPVAQSCKGRTVGLLAAVDDDDSRWSQHRDVPESPEPFQLPTIQLVSTHVLRGRLVDAAGKPLENYVVLGSVEGWRDSSTPTTARGEFETLVPDGSEIESYAYISPTGRSGRLAVETADPLLLRVELVPGAKEPGAARPAAAKSERVVAADRDAETKANSDNIGDVAATAAEANVETEFLVTDEQQRPIPSGALELRGYYDNGDFFEQERAIKAGRATFEFQRPRLRELVVSLSATGFRSHLREYKVEGTERGFEVARQYTYQLKAGVAIGGKVVDEAGRPLPGVHVFLSSPSTKREDGGLDHAEGSFQTDADGKWSCPGVAPELQGLALRFEHATHVDESSKTMTPYFRHVKPEELAGLRAQTDMRVMHEDPPVVGKIVDAAGQPIPEVTVDISGRDPDWSQHFARGLVIKTNEAGEFRVPRPPHGEQRLTLRHPNGIRQVVELTVPPAEPLTITLTKGRRMEFRVMDTAGAPIPNVTFLPEVSGAEFRGKTDAEGRWVWENAPDEKVRYQIVSNDYLCQPPNSNYGPEDSPVTLTLRRNLPVVGKVVDADSGAPIREFRLYNANHFKTDPADLWEWWMESSKAVRPVKGSWAEGKVDGRPRTQLEPGEFHHRLYTLDRLIRYRIQADGYLPALSEPLDAATLPDKPVQLEFRLKKYERIVASVRTPNGQPAAGTEVVTAMKRGNENSTLTIQNGAVSPTSGSKLTVAVRADATGRFELPVHNDPFACVITHEAGYLELLDRELAGRSELTLLPWKSIEGTVDVLKAPAPGVQMTFHRYRRDPRADGSEAPNVGFFLTAMTDAAGRYRLPHAFPGTWDAFVSYPAPPGSEPEPPAGDRRSPWQSASFDLDVTNAETTTLDLGRDGVDVVGRVVAPEGVAIDRLFSGVRFERQVGRDLNGHRRWEIYQVRLAVDGSFRCFNLRPGEYEGEAIVGEADDPVFSYRGGAERKKGFEKALQLKTDMFADRSATVPIDLGTIVVEPVK